MLRGPSLALPGHVDIEEVADASRHAVRAFLAMEPDKVSLSAWLVGPYREATSFGPRRSHSMRPDAPPAEHHTSPANIENLVTISKAVVGAALTAAWRGTDDLVELLPPVLRIVPAHDIYGNHGFIPVDEARMHLVDRVLALLVADYLTRPSDFQPRLALVSGTHPTRREIAVGLRVENTG